jgi:hypothetical protein
MAKTKICERASRNLDYGLSKIDALSAIVVSS